MNVLLSTIADKNIADYVVNFLSNFFGTPALLVGLAALIGSLLQRKNFAQVITSVFKTIIGFLIIGGGAGIVAGSIGHFGAAFQLLFNREGFIANNDIIPGLFLSVDGLAWITSAGSLILIFAMMFNIILAKISGLKYIYLTGHSAWYFSVMIAGVLAISGLKNTALDTVLVVAIGTLLVSMWMVISPAMLNRHMKVITKGDQLALAHTGSLTYVLAGYTGELVNKASKGKVRSTESFNFPKGLAFLRNTNVSIAITMLVLYIVVYMTTWGVRGELAMAEAGIIAKDGSQSIFVQGLIQAFTFAAGVEVLLIGVRMFIAEIVPAFKGISDKLVRNAKPGIDCPVVFPFAPNAVIMGFIASAIGGFVIFGLNIGISSAIPSGSAWAIIVIPSIVPHFFTGAAAGVFGNAKGGVIGCLLGAFINGMLISFVPWIFLGLGLFQSEISQAGNGAPVVWGDADFILGVIPAMILQWTNKWVLLGISIAGWASIPAISYGIHFYKMSNNEVYAANQVSEKNLLMQLKAEKKALKVNYQKTVTELMSSEEKTILKANYKKGLAELKMNQKNNPQPHSEFEGQKKALKVNYQNSLAELNLAQKNSSEKTISFAEQKKTLHQQLEKDLVAKQKEFDKKFQTNNDFYKGIFQNEKALLKELSLEKKTIRSAYENNLFYLKKQVENKDDFKNQKDSLYAQLQEDLMVKQEEYQQKIHEVKSVVAQPVQQ